VGTVRNNPLAAWVKESRLPTSPGEKLNEKQLTSLYNYASSYVTQQLQNKYPGFRGYVQYIPQPFNRRFEASTVYSDGVIPEAGSISSELASKYKNFNPANTYRGYSPDPQTGDKAVGSNGNIFDTRSWMQRIPWHF
jgi:hypothetical protein